MATRDRSESRPRARVTLVPLAAEHIPEIMVIERAAFVDPWVRQAFDRELVNDFSRSFVALDGEERVVGYLVYWVAGPEFHILNIAVRSDMKKRGIGQILMNHVISDARGADGDFVALEVRPSNTPARNLYLRYGFVTVGFRPGYYKDGESAEVMLLHLRK